MEPTPTNAQDATTRTPPQHHAMAMRADDVRALVALVEKLEACRRSTVTADGNHLIHATVREDDAFTRCGQNLLTHAREYLAAVTALEPRAERRAFHETLPGGAAKGGGADDEWATRRVEHMETSGYDMTTPPLSPPSASVLTGVLRRENASLIAKIRRLEEEAKRTDDKSAWGEEHFVRRVKALEIQCTEAVAEKTRLEVKCTEALAERDRLKIERDAAVAAKDAMVTKYAEAEAEKDRAKTECAGLLTDKRRLQRERDEAVAAKECLETKCANAAAETRCAENNIAAIVADNDRLRAQSADAIREKDRLNVQCAELAAQNDLLKKQYAEAIAEKIRLEDAWMQAAKEKDQFESKCIEAVTEYDLLKVQYVKLVTEHSDLGNQHAESASQKEQLELDCASHQVVANELRDTITLLQTQLTHSEQALCEAKEAAAAMETQLTRAKRSDTMETSGTDSDDSEAPTRLSMRVLAIEDDCESRPEIDVASQRTARSRTRSGDGFASHRGDASTRRRSAVRARSNTVSSTDSRKSQPGTPLDPARPCSRSRCAQVNQLASPSKSETFRHPLRTSFHVGSPAPSCASVDESSETPGRFRASQSKVSSHQPNESRPRWRW